MAPTWGLLGKTVASAVCWSGIHHLCSEPVIYAVLPSTTYSKLTEARTKDRNLNSMCRVNAAALLHAAFIVPLALVALTDPVVQENLPSGHTPLFTFLTVIMSGYFLWDTQCCLKNVKQYGTAFLLHGIVSFAAIFTQAGASQQSRFEYYSLLFMLTELSTPLLHIRWFILKARDANTRYFKFINTAFIIIFTAVRLVFTEVFCFFPFVKAMLFTHSHLFTAYQKAIYMSVVILWLALNVYWGVLLLHSQAVVRAKRRSKKPQDPFTELVQPSKES